MSHENMKQILSLGLLAGIAALWILLRLGENPEELEERRDYNMRQQEAKTRQSNTLATILMEGVH